MLNYGTYVMAILAIVFLILSLAIPGTPQYNRIPIAVRTENQGICICDGCLDNFTDIEDVPLDDTLDEEEEEETEEGTGDEEKKKKKKLRPPPLPGLILTSSSSSSIEDTGIPDMNESLGKKKSAGSMSAERY